MSSPSAKGAKKCAQCGREFVCEIAAGKSHCWCFDFPKVMPVTEGAECLCPECLKKAINEKPNASK